MLEQWENQSQLLLMQGKGDTLDLNKRPEMLPRENNKNEDGDSYKKLFD